MHDAAGKRRLDQGAEHPLIQPVVSAPSNSLQRNYFRSAPALLILLVGVMTTDLEDVNGLAYCIDGECYSVLL
jgi:hypothetical protein